MTIGLRSSQFFSLVDFVGGNRDELPLCPIYVLSGSIRPGWSSTVPTFPVCLSPHLRGRNGCSKTPLHFGLDGTSTALMHLPWKRSADCLGSECSRSRRLPCHCCFVVLYELHSPTGAEGFNLVFTEYLLSLLPLRWHPQAYGNLLHQSFGGSSAGLVAHWPLWSPCSNSHSRLFVAVSDCSHLNPHVQYVIGFFFLHSFFCLVTKGSCRSLTPGRH